jgi:membrane protein implicated in regulation of membrane protease activity
MRVEFLHSVPPYYCYVAIVHVKHIGTKSHKDLLLLLLALVVVVTVMTLLAPVRVSVVVVVCVLLLSRNTRTTHISTFSILEIYMAPEVLARAKKCQRSKTTEAVEQQRHQQNAGGTVLHGGGRGGEQVEDEQWRKGYSFVFSILSVQP